MIGVLRREPVFAAGLNHWDEIAAYTALYCAVTALAVVAAGAILAAVIGLETAFYVRGLID